MILTSPTVLQPPQGCQVSYNDWTELVTFMVTNASIGTALQQGVTNALPPIQPLALSFPVSGSMIVGVGASSTSHPQWVLCQGLLCASVGNPVNTLVEFTVPNNSTGGNRVDAICVQATTLQVSTVNRPVEQTDGSKPIQAVPEVIYTPGFFYAEGPSGGGNPTIPSGYENFAYITVPNGASSITEADVTLNFPYMNPTAFTVTTSSTAVPAEGSNVTISVNDTSVWVDGDFGYLVGPNSNNGFIFEVVSVDSNALTLTVTNVNTTINGSGSIPIGAYVLPSGVAPVACTITGTAVPAIGSNVKIYLTNTGLFPAGSYGMIIGRVFGASFYFYVVANGHDGTGTYINVTNLGPGGGGNPLFGFTLLVGSTVIPAVPPGIVEEDQNNGGILNPSMITRTKMGTVSSFIGGVGAVTFDVNLPYTSGDTYGISIEPTAAGTDWRVTSKLATGFNITMTTPSTFNWKTSGY